MNSYISLSGGLDSTALAILKAKDWQCIFADTGDEFPQVYEFLERVERKLRIKIIRVQRQNETLRDYELRAKYFPNAAARYCTRMFKIQPIEKFLEQHKPYELALALRYDERWRTGNTDSYAIYPLIEMGFTRRDVVRICEEHDLVPHYPWYMNRGGCYSCFFKSKRELVGFVRAEPELTQDLIRREEAVQDARDKFYYLFDKTRTNLRSFRDQVLANKQEELFPVGSKQELHGIEYSDCGIFCRK